MSLATRYATAALAVAQESPDYASFQNSVATLAEAMNSPAVLAGLTNPRLSPAQRTHLATMLGKACAAPKALTNLLQVLALNRRLNNLPAILLALQNQIALRAGVTPLTVHTTTPLTDAQKIQLKVQVKTFSKSRDVALTEIIKPELLGGFRAFFGGLVWDTSVQSSLAHLKARLSQANNA